MGSLSYCEMRRMKCKSLDLRWHLVAHAREHGIKPTARAFRCSVLTVRKWLRRHAAEGLAGLHDRSRAPHHCPHKTAPETERCILAQRARTPRFGANRLHREFALPASSGAIQRVLRQHGLTRRRRKAHQRKRDLRAVKAAWPALRRLQMDTKHLDDIPHYWPHITSLGLPEFQFSTRCPRTGATFLAYGGLCTALYAELAARHLLTHLCRHGIDTRDVVLQTDLGSEFEGNAMTPRDHGFDHLVQDTFHARHRRIPNPNHNADVESLHNLVELELFDIETFRSRADFFEKLATYQAYFNLARPNSYKNWNTPADILAQAEPKLPLNILLLPPADLDMLAKAHLEGDHYLPALPAAA